MLIVIIIMSVPGVVLSSFMYRIPSMFSLSDEKMEVRLNCEELLEIAEAKREFKENQNQNNS